MSQALKLEIIRHILSKFGASSDLKNITGYGFIKNNMLCVKTIDFESNGSVTRNPFWAGYLDISSSLIRCAASSFLDESQGEFALVIHMDDLRPYGVRLSLNHEDSGSLQYQLSSGVWIDASTQLQATVLAGVEKLSELPFSWSKYDEIRNESEINQLYSLMVDFINSEVS